MTREQGRKNKNRRSSRSARKGEHKPREELYEKSPSRIVLPKEEHVKVFVIGLDGEHHLYRIKDCAWAMGRLKRAYARKCGMDPASLRLILDGRTLRDIDCPPLLCLDDGDKLECGWAY